MVCAWIFIFCLFLLFFFFFQAEDGIRDLIVTGVQTCALPISRRRCRVHATVCGVGSVLQVTTFVADLTDPPRWSIIAVRWRGAPLSLTQGATYDAPPRFPPRRSPRRHRIGRQPLDRLLRPLTRRAHRAVCSTT